MDIIEVAPGNTVHLPVYVPGGYLYLGDAHAATLPRAVVERHPEGQL